MRGLWLVVVAAVACLLAGGCSSVEEQTPAARESPTAAPTVPPVERAVTELATLRVVDRHPGGPAYDRDAFGSAWVDTDGNGCNQRDDVLLRDAIPGSTTVAEQGACDHDVLAGTWIDPYTGKRIVLDDLKDLSQAQAVQIDHVVPLGEAWISGAAEWGPKRRVRFANDLAELLASDGPTNASKSDDDPAAWRPKAPYQCSYARRWIHTKFRWRLGADPSEIRALKEMLDRC